MSPRSFGPTVLAFGVVLATTGLNHSAAAESIAQHPGDHPAYSFEAEPHLALPLGLDGFGPGFRGTVVLVDNGFVSTINNSVGLGFGLDWIFYGHGCHGPDRDRHCDAPSGVILPVVMQWNFWLHPHWSVFGEPGIAFHVQGGSNDHVDFDWFTIYVGGRYHFSDNVALTMRLGAPLLHDNVFSIGVSFLL
jgi:hypothetical protein